MNDVGKGVEMFLNLGKLIFKSKKIKKPNRKILSYFLKILKAFDDFELPKSSHNKVPTKSSV